MVTLVAICFSLKLKTRLFQWFKREICAFLRRFYLFLLTILSTRNKDKRLQIEELIKDADIKPTNARKEILKLLVAASKPLSYRDIEAQISMDKATFYRNIAIFEESHIVSSFESNDKKRYFEIAKVPHAHFICNGCNEVECLQKSLEFGLDGYWVENIIVKGLCPMCREGIGYGCL